MTDTRFRVTRTKTIRDVKEVVVGNGGFAIPSAAQAIHNAEQGSSTTWTAFGDRDYVYTVEPL